MPAFGYIEYENAPPEVKAVYDDIMATRKIDWVSNFWKSIAHDPHLLKRTWTSLKEVMGPGSLDPLTKELIYLAVSASNQCHYCIASHTASSWKAGMTAAMFGEVMSIVGMANETNKLVSGYQVEVDARFQVHEKGWQDYPSPRTVVERYLRSVECFDCAGVMDLIDPNLRAFDGNEQIPYEQAGAFVNQLAAGLTDFKFEVEHWHECGEWVSEINVVTGVHTGPLFGIPATGVRFSVRGMGMFRVVKGKIVEAHGQWDMGALLRQLGALGVPPRAPSSAREVVETYLEAISRFDIDAMLALLDPGVRAFDGSEPVGYEQIAAYWKQISDGVSEFRIMPEKWAVDGEWVSFVNDATGVHTGPLFGLARSDAKFTIRGMAMFRVVNGKITEIHSQWDMGSLLRQIGGAAPFRAPQV